MNEYSLVAVKPDSFEVTKCLANEIFDAVMTALDRWRYYHVDWVAYYVITADGDKIIDVSKLASMLYHEEALFALKSKTDDRFDEEKFIIQFIKEEMQNV